MERRAHLLIKGKVQGVFYRQNAKKKADELGLTGYVKNLPNEEVEAIAEGPIEKVKEFIAWCWKGSENAIVKNVAVVWHAPKKDSDMFEIRQ